MFDKPGVAALGCYIHDQMIAYVYVTETPWIGRTDETGKADIAALPAGAYTVKIWHPSLRPGQKVPSQAVTIGDGAAALMPTLPLLPTKPNDHSHGLY